MHALHDIIVATPLGLPAFIFVITVVVFFHELGHFLVARACGVKVEVFSIGFGKEIVGRTDARGTRWKVSWLPIGGYVRFAGDANAASAPDREAAARVSAAERAVMLQFKPLWQRAAVAVAGPLANFVVAIIILTGLLMIGGHAILPPVVGSVVQGSAAEAAGIRADDRIVSVNGTAIDDYYQLPEIISMRGGENLAIDLERGSQRLTVHAIPRLVRQKNILGEMEATYVIGVRPSTKVTPIQVTYTPWGALGAATVQTGTIIQETLVGVVKMVQGHASPDQIRGTVGIVDVTHKVAQLGFLALLNLAAVLSVSIGLANLFPIPLLDGGHLLYYGCEAVLGRPLGERAQELGFRFGVILIVGLVLASAFHDLARLNLF
jgi:regulator of sigma E protease